MSWRKGGEDITILKERQSPCRKVKSFTVTRYIEHEGEMKHEKQHFAYFSYSLSLCFITVEGKKIKQSTRTRSKVWKATVLVLNTKQEVLCSNQTPLLPTLFWSQIRSSISRSLMSNNKRRTLFSVKVYLQHRKISIQQWEDRNQKIHALFKTQTEGTYRNTNNLQQTLYLLIVLFQVPPIVSYSFKRHKLKKYNQNTQPILTSLPSPKNSHPT